MRLVKSSPDEPAVLVVTRADAAKRQRTRLMIDASRRAGYVVDLLGPDVIVGTLPIRSHHPLVRRPGRNRAENALLARLEASTAAGRSGPVLEYYLGRRLGPAPSVTRSVRTGTPYRGVVVEEPELLPWAIRVARNRCIPVVMDLHDIHWVPNGDSQRARDQAVRTRTLLSDYLPRVTEVLTVSEAQRDLLRELVGVDSTVIMSCSPFVELAPSSVRSEAIALVHHGQARRDRRIDQLVDVVAGLAGAFTLDLYLTLGEAAYITELKEQAARTQNVLVREPVPLERLVIETNQYDVGIAYFEPTTPNLATTVPTKFFEYVQARLAVLAGPSPDMARLIEQWGFGMVTDGFSAEQLRRALLELDPEDVATMKQRSHQGSHTLSFETESVKLAAVFRETFE